MIVFYGDSCTRELYKVAARRLSPNRSALVTDPRYAPRMNDSEPNAELWGRQMGAHIVALPFNDSRKAYCWSRGCGTGVDFDACGEPGKDSVAGVSFASKSYVDTPEWDGRVRRWMETVGTRLLVLDPPLRWGLRPARCCQSSNCSSEKGELTNEILKLLDRMRSPKWTTVLLASAASLAQVRPNWTQEVGQHPVVPVGFYDELKVARSRYGRTVRTGHCSAGTLLEHVFRSSNLQQMLEASRARDMARVDGRGWLQELGARWCG